MNIFLSFIDIFVDPWKKESCLEWSYKLGSLKFTQYDSKPLKKDRSSNKSCNLYIEDFNYILTLKNGLHLFELGLTKNCRGLIFLVNLAFAGSVTLLSFRLQAGAKMYTTDNLTWEFYFSLAFINISGKLINFEIGAVFLQ